MRRTSPPRQAGHGSPAHRCSVSVTPGEQSRAAPHPSQGRHSRCTAMKAGASAQAAGKWCSDGQAATHMLRGDATQNGHFRSQQCCVPDNGAPGVCLLSTGAQLRKHSSLCLDSGPPRI